MTAYTTAAKNTQEEIIAEAKLIPNEVRRHDEIESAKILRALREETGLTYSTSVSKARFQLQILDFSGKRVSVTAVSEFLPFYEYSEFLRSYRP